MHFNWFQCNSHVSRFFLLSINENNSLRQQQKLFYNCQMKITNSVFVCFDNFTSALKVTLTLTLLYIYSIYIPIMKIGSVGDH